MKKITTCSLVLLLMPCLIFSQNFSNTPGQIHAGKSWHELTSSTPSGAEINLLSSDIETSRLEIVMQGFWEEPVRTLDGVPEIKASTGNSTPLLIKGAPDLEKLIVSLAIPDMARMQISIIEEEFTDIPEIHIIPSKGNLTRDIDPDEIPYEYGREYELDAFFPGVQAELRSPHIIRDVRGQVVLIYPFRYNPVKKILRVYTRLVIEVKVAGQDGENRITERQEDVKTIRAFEGIYSRNFINYTQYQGVSRYTPLEEDGNMLIISYGPFMTAMQDFIEWKSISGMPVEMIDVTAIGTTAAAIKSFVAGYYNTNGLTYLLLVGDAAQVPASSTSAGASDNDYGYIVGNDHYPDIFVGRFSAETVAHVQTQVQRTLNYEQEPGGTNNSYQRAMCIASAEGPGDDGEYDWQHQRNIRNDYMGFTYSYGAEMYDGSQGGQDAAGNPTPTMVSTEINAGIGVISYTGHGSNTSWGTTGYSNTNVINLSNNGKLPFILSVACVNGNFVGLTCFAEAWLRATYNGQPSGAVATIMSTINQSWNPPMQGQDEMVDILAESYPLNIKRTFGGICMNGCMNMNDVYGTAGADMTDTWTIFGDPSLMVRTDVPEAMSVTHPGDLPLGSGQLTVLCDQEGARVAVTNNYQLLATGYISNGSAVLNFSPVINEDTLIVAVTAFNCIPSIDSVFISNAEMTYVSSQAFHDNLNGAAPGQQDVEVLGVKIIMSGSLEPFGLLSMNFNMNGTTSLQDVTGLSVYFSGNLPDFNTAVLFGQATASGGMITITGNQILNGGFNYFWLAYDLDGEATLENQLDAECTGLVLSDNISMTRIPSATDPDGARTIEVMEITGINTTQPDTQPVFPGNQDVDIICVNIQTDGTPLPLQVTSLKISLAGTTDLDDISTVKIYYTIENVFATTGFFGSVTPGGIIVISGAKILADGNNYFWIAYDISPAAGAGNELDAECIEVAFTGSQGIQYPITTDPPGYRTIELNYCIPSYSTGTGDGDFISLVQLNTLSKSSSASPAPYYNFYTDVTTCLVPGSNYNLVVSPGTYSSGNNIAAWIDFNRDGTFQTGEKLGEVSVAPMPVTGTINFTVPVTAFIGPVRLRVREVWSTTGFDPCNTYTYGETEDYQVHIMAPGTWLGFTNVWNNPSNWSNGAVPGPGSCATIPEILLGSFYPSNFSGGSIIVDEIIMEDGTNLGVPAGTVITVGGQ